VNAEKNLQEPERFRKMQDRDTVTDMKETTVMNMKVITSMDMNMDTGTTTNMSILIIMVMVTAIMKEETKKYVYCYSINHGRR
jgi:hypothetical protein